MKIDGLTLGSDPAAVPEEARQVEERGYDGWFTGETAHDPFLTMGLAATTTSRMELGTGIAVAFARNPMDVAYRANDLQLLSGGRFVLGLGTQIKPHVTKRFGMEWSKPAARMREFVLALRAIWRCWNEGERLDFRGDFYRHTLMTPFFSPGENPHGPPPVFLAAVGPLMTRAAGEVCDGLLAHAFTTDRYLREVTLPALREGAEAGGRSLDDLDVALGVFVVTGYDEEQRSQAEQFVKGQIAFYGSTPAYKRVLDLHGWGDLQPELNRLSKEGRWGDMSDLIDDEVLDAFAIRCDPDQVGPRIVERYGDLISRVSLYTPFVFEDADWDAFRKVVAAA